MENVVNNPAPVQEKGDNGGSGFLIGAVILIIFVGILLYFAIPALQNRETTQINLPATEIEVVVPDNTNQEATPSVPVEPTE